VFTLTDLLALMGDFFFQAMCLDAQVTAVLPGVLFDSLLLMTYTDLTFLQVVSLGVNAPVRATHRLAGSHHGGSAWFRTFMGPPFTGPPSAYPPLTGLPIRRPLFMGPSLGARPLRPGAALTVMAAFFLCLTLSGGLAPPAFGLGLRAEGQHRHRQHRRSPSDSLDRRCPGHRRPPLC